MGVANLNSEYRITKENGLLDFEATVKKLKELMKLIDTIELPKHLQ